jgi:hypothetical protein
MNLLTSPTLPTNGTNEVQRITLTGAPSGGTFKLRFGSAVMSGTLPYNASAAAVQAALRALPTIGSTGVTCSGGPLDSSPVDVTFGGRLGRMDVLPIQVVSSAFTGGTSPAVTVSTVTPGVAGTQRSAAAGQILLYGPEVYFNHGVPYAPDWQPYLPSAVPQVVLAAPLTLTKSQLNSLSAAGQVWVPAVTGKRIIPLQLVGVCDNSGTAYAGGDFAVGYGSDASAGLAFEWSPACVFATGTNLVSVKVGDNDSTATGFSTAAPVGAPLRIGAVAPITSGLGTFTAVMLYSLV